MEQELEIIEELSIYRDGGTKHVKLSNDKYAYIDNRIGSSTINAVYDKYPGDKTSVIIGIYNGDTRRVK